MRHVAKGEGDHYLNRFECMAENVPLTEQEIAELKEMAEKVKILL